MSAAKAMLAKTMAAQRNERRKRKRTTKTISADDSARPRRSVSWVRTASLSSSSRISRAPAGRRGSTWATARLYVVRHAHDVGADLLDHLERDGRLPVDAVEAARLLVRVAHDGHVLQPHHAPLVRQQR